MQTFLLALIIALAQTVETVTGFGSTILALALGAQIFPVKELVPALVLIGIAQSVWLAARGWKNIKWRLFLAVILPVSGVGLLAGRLLSSRIAGGELKPLLGLFVIAVSAAELYGLLRGGRPTRPLNPIAGSAFLLAGGIVHGIFATGGPLVVFYASRQIGDKAAFRATLSMLWLILNVVFLAAWIFTEGFGPGPVKLAAWMLPSLAAGIGLGELLHGRVDERTFRIAVQALLLITGALLVV
jgi:uncharacterized membrane protein YfcA